MAKIGTWFLHGKCGCCWHAPASRGHHGKQLTFKFDLLGSVVVN